MRKIIMNFLFAAAFLNSKRKTETVFNKPNYISENKLYFILVLLNLQNC